MATILTAGNSEGTRRCDTRCHDAAEADCDCICGGRYHGRGEDLARQQLVDDLEDGLLGAELAEIARAVREAGYQAPLF